MGNPTIGETYKGVEQLMYSGPFLVVINRTSQRESIRLYKSATWVLDYNNYVLNLRFEEPVAFLIAVIHYAYYFPKWLRYPQRCAWLKALPFYPEAPLEDAGRYKIPILKLNKVYYDEVLHRGNPHYGVGTKKGRVGLDIIRGYSDVYVSKIANVDREFVDAPVSQEIVIPAPLSEDTIIPSVYDRFADYVKIVVTDGIECGSKSMSGTPTFKVQGLRFTEFKRVYEAWRGETFLPWSEIDGKLCWGVKPASIKKDGSRRLVYPMSPKMNAYITQRYGKSYAVLPDNVSVVRRVCDWRRFRYSYDVKDCDRVMWPYFKKLINDPIFEAYVRFNGENYPLPQFPSGCCVFMKFVTTAFTVALCDLGNVACDVQIQGDGFAMDLPLGDDFLQFVRAFPKNEINGFKIVKDGFACYTRADEKLTTPILCSGTIRGVEKWQFRKEIYVRLLNARCTLADRDPLLAGRFRRMTTRELMDYAQGKDPEMVWTVLHAQSDYDGAPCSWSGATVDLCCWL